MSYSTQEHRRGIYLRLLGLSPIDDEHDEHYLHCYLMVSVCVKLSERGVVGA